MLTPEIVRELRKPFAPEQIKWKIQTNPREGDEYAVVVAYLDARDITERLDLATGGDWWNDYAIPQVKAGGHAVLECRLTVCGVTRCDVGSVPIPDRDDATKDLYSDAMKRAAVQFGIASHIYRFPSVKAKVEKFGKGFYLTRRAKDELLLLNKCLIGGQQPPRYTDIKVSGDSWGADGNAGLFEEPAAPKKPPTRAGIIERLSATIAEARELGIVINGAASMDDKSDTQLIAAGTKLRGEIDRIRAGEGTPEGR
jgi:hypothetical protein